MLFLEKRILDRWDSIYCLRTGHNQFVDHREHRKGQFSESFDLFWR